jgi:uncharacterized 2Fe-2S/4Fe-4S cluster protein (DUF4445 family)
MAKLTVRPLNQVVESRPGESVRQALQREGIHIDGACDGQGVCGQCTIWARAREPVPETPHERISSSEAAKGLRLSCQLPADRDMDLELCDNYTLEAFSRFESGPILVGDLNRSEQIDPAVQVAQRNGFWRLIYDQGDAEPLSRWSEHFEPKGLAIDIGTTTLVVSLISLVTGQELATASSLNPQIRFGHDVLTRIQKGSSPEGLDELTEAVREGLNELIAEVCQASSSDHQEILDAVVGGNTTMLELCAGINPEPLGHLPFQVDIQSGGFQPVSSFGLQANPKGRVYIPPVIHAFVGSDISSGLLVSGGFFEDQGRMLFLDVGTNGEMGVSNGTERLVTSTAAGPAFEGAGLSSGMRAARGAVEAVTRWDGELHFATIGDASPRGICGSGLIELLSMLLQTGLLDPSGRLHRAKEVRSAPERLSRYLVEEDDQPVFRIAPGVVLKQNDIRQLQLAKAAIRTGMDLLLQETGIEPESLDRVVIGGGFGNFLRPPSLEAIGMLPPNTAHKVVFGGNTSRQGCAELLVSVSKRRFLEQEVKEVRHLPIAERSEFMDRFVLNMEFPEPGREASAQTEAHLTSPSGQ